MAEAASGAVGVAKTLFTAASEVKRKLDEMKANIKECEQLGNHIERTVEPLKKLGNNFLRKDNMKKFLEDTSKIVGETNDLIERIRKSGKLIRFACSGDHRGELQEKDKEIDRLYGQLVPLLILVMMSEDEHIRKVKPCGKPWDVDYIEACHFCHVTEDDDVIIAVTNSDIGEEKKWTLIKYNKEGIEQWNWECPEEGTGNQDVGEPSDLTQIKLNGKNHLLILLEQKNKIVLLPEDTKSPIEVYKGIEQGYRLRRIAAMDDHRIVVSLDPTISQHHKSSKLKVLNIEKRPFTKIRDITLDSKVTHSLSRVSHENLCVVCDSPPRIQVFDVDMGHSKWHLGSIQIGDCPVYSQRACCVDNDVCVYDSNGKQIITVFDGKFGSLLLRKAQLGDQVYGVAYMAEENKLVILHDKDTEKLRITLFNIETDKKVK